MKATFLPCIDNNSKLRAFGISWFWLMRSLIHLCKVRKNQVLNILLIICIFPDAIFLLLLCLIDWYLMASDNKALFSSWLQMRFECPQSWDIFPPGCKFWTVWPFSTKMGGVVFQRICFPTASRKSGGQVADTLFIAHCRMSSFFSTRRTHTKFTQKIQTSICKKQHLSRQQRSLRDAHL